MDTVVVMVSRLWEGFLVAPCWVDYSSKVCCEL
jgi:hypothetical protein